MRKIIPFLLLSFHLGGQSITPEKLCKLPEFLDENSGMIVLNDSTLILHNDSGNEPYLYIVNDRCEVLSTHWLIGVRNIDWEAITRDTRGNIYVGDIGNNNNNRKEVVIYKIKTEDVLSKESSQPEKIRLTYVDSFPPSKQRRMYDAEALVWHKDSLFIFSKNRREPYDGVSWVFGFPDQPGEYQIQPIDSIRIQGLNRIMSWVTDAAYDAGSKLLLLLGSNKITAIQAHPDSVFWRGRQTTISLPMVTQKEAIGFGSTLLFISDENHPLIPGGMIYRFPKKKLFSLLEIDPLVQPFDFSVRVQEKMVEDSLVFSFRLPYDTWMAYELLNQEGTQVKIAKPTELESGYHQFTVSLETLNPEIYIFNVLIDGIPTAFIIRKKGDPRKAIEGFQKEQHQQEQYRIRGN
jgi:hypothetical protein